MTEYIVANDEIQVQVLVGILYIGRKGVVQHIKLTPLRPKFDSWTGYSSPFV